MKKEEINKIKEYFPDGSIVDYKTLSRFILENFENKREKNIGFYIFDLVKDNVIYQLNNGMYKLSSKKIFRMEIPESIISYMEPISLEYPEVEICVWESNVFNQFMEMQLFKNQIYIEVEKGFEMLVFEKLSKNTGLTTLLKPSMEEISNYKSLDNLLVLKPLLNKAPTNRKRFTKQVGFNVNYHGNRNSISTPKIEKILVDVFTDNNLSFISEKEKYNFYFNSLKNYTVNFKTLLSYARNRNKKELIEDYIKNVIRFDINVGEFYDY